tara:strand:+ start:3491 stop:5563 length:2073 start_codon:yes stop_codon:yes gene_type:complete
MASSAMGLIRVVPNSEMVRREKEQQEQAEAARVHNDSILLQGLARHVTAAWLDARDAKNAVLYRLQRARRARIGEYDSDKLADIEDFGGSTEYARVTANKVRIVEAWLRDVYSGQTDRPWTITPTPKPSMPEAITEQVRAFVSEQVAAVAAQTGQMPDPSLVRSQMSAEMSRFEEAIADEARATAKRMENRMDDQLKQAGFNSEFADFLADLATYPSAVMKGPVLRRKKTLRWESVEGDDQPQPVVSEDIIPEFERVDPFRAYPAPGASTTQEGYFIEHHTLTHTDLYEMIGLPGYDESAIRAVLNEGGNLTNWLGLSSSDDGSSPSIPDQLQREVFEYDALEYHGPVLGKDLMVWGLDDPSVNDPEKMYEACIWMIGRWVIKAQLNYDPVGLRPYYSTSYEEIPGEFWGFGIPDVLDDVQGVANAAVRSLVNNMGMASGPQVGINIDRLPAGQDVTNLRPWKIWQFEDNPLGSNTMAPIEFFQPDSNISDLLAVIEKFYQLADDFSLVPRYMAGSDNVGGAGRTASGLSMLMDAANKGLKGVVSNVDVDVISPMLQKLYNHNMLYDPDPTIKGDAQIVASGAVSLMRIESMQLRRNEFLQVTNNPADLQITGTSGRAEVLRAVAEGLDLNTDKIVPPEETMQQNQQMQQAQAVLQQGTQGAAPSAIGSAEVLMDGSATTDNFSPNSLTP